jgi:hypothetical protein
MKYKELKNTTWQDVLAEHNVDEAASKSLIGFVSWNRNEPSPLIGKDITGILKDSRGNVIVKDVGSKSYNDRGLLFVDKEMDIETANEIFDIIMEYE